MNTSNDSTSPMTLQSKQVEIRVHGRVFAYMLTRVTSRCWVFANPVTGAVRQFGSFAAFRRYFAELAAYLSKKHQPLLLAQPRIAGLLPPVAGLQTGECEGWLNAHWSPLAVDGWVVEVGGHRYCPHCASAYSKAMEFIRK